MTTDVQAHRQLVKAQARLWTLLLSVLLIVEVVSLGVQHHQRTEAFEQVAISKERAHFWRVIAGTETPNTQTIDSFLASDLHNRLGMPNPGTQTLPKAITSFRGTSNSYGGITEALGQDPFDETGLSCSECGPLTDVFKAKLLLVKQGQAELVIAGETADPPQSYSVGLLGLPGLWTLLLLWLGGGAAILRLALQQTKLRLNRLGWLHGKETKKYRIATFLMAPAVMLPYLLFRRSEDYDLESRMKRKFPEEMLAIRDADAKIEEIKSLDPSDPSIASIENDRNRLYSMVQSWLRDDEVSAPSQSIEELKGRLQSSISALEAGNDAYRQL